MAYIIHNQIHKKRKQNLNSKKNQHKLIKSPKHINAANTATNNNRTTTTSAATRAKPVTVKHR